MATIPATTVETLDIFVPLVLGIDYVNRTEEYDVLDPSSSIPGATKRAFFTKWNFCALKSALAVAGVNAFAQFQNLRLRHFERMQCKEPGDPTMPQLPVWTAAHAVMCVAFYHWLRSKYIPKDEDLISPVFIIECPALLNDFHYPMATSQRTWYRTRTEGFGILEQEHSA